MFIVVLNTLNYKIFLQTHLLISRLSQCFVIFIICFLSVHLSLGRIKENTGIS